MDCSVIICTRDRASMLEATLNSFRAINVPEDWRVELIVADNGSKDSTEAIVRRTELPRMEIRYVHVPEPGKSRAQNAALATARGVALLFTDDDVEPASDWLEKMGRPMLEGRCEAVAGAIQLGAELHRPWITPMHRIWLAWIPEPDAEAPQLIGASMGVLRSVFETIGPFDEELGPGASGFGEETLLWMQLKTAGMRILPVSDTRVIHHPEPSRLLRRAWLAAAQKFGRTDAYLKYHWEHRHVSRPECRVWWVWAKLSVRRFFAGRKDLDSEGCPAWEMSYLVELACFERLKIESCRPRRYSHRGLRLVG